MATPQRTRQLFHSRSTKKNREHFHGRDWFVAWNEMKKMSAICTICEHTCILKREAMYGYDFANND